MSYCYHFIGSGPCRESDTPPQVLQDPPEQDKQEITPQSVANCVHMWNVGKHFPGNNCRNKKRFGKTCSHKQGLMQAQLPESALDYIISNGLKLWPIFKWVHDLIDVDAYRLTVCVLIINSTIGEHQLIIYNAIMTA